MNNEVKYSIQRMIETKFEYNYKYDFSNFDISDMQFNLSHNIDVDIENNIVKVCVSVECSDKNNVQVASNELLGAFLVEPLNSVISNTENGKITSSISELLVTFVNILIGGLRGVWMKNLKGTPLESAIIPLIPMSIIRDNINND